MSLTELQCRQAKPSTKAYRLHDGQGLYLDVRPTGKRVWRQKYSIHGKDKTFMLGVYPDITLVKALEKRDVTKQVMTEGIAPSLAKQHSKRLAKCQAAQTFETVAREWQGAYKSCWTERYAGTLLNRLEQNAFASLGNMPMTAITPPMIFACVHKIEERRHGELATASCRLLVKCFAMRVHPAVPRVIKRAICAGASQHHEKGHFANASIDELSTLLHKLKTNEGRLYRQTTIAMMLMLLTFVRTSELIEARWSEFDLEKKNGSFRRNG